MVSLRYLSKLINLNNQVELILCKYDEELVFDTTQALGVFYNWVTLLFLTF